ncbi:hypothetical protein VSS74_17160 [Conexibacter stalactiti]|uniref:MarR family transcriptional regulator n=1 Tax=Conexibacter stalactiti TaxID=1940611 RepID=A0ABU4HSB0_9ACTN|nr:hypothetical protein [Conexibacter stalactiti]MDW5596079.1 hypothetical protein [Conexibacter stalactiti]MEC5036721.1 hypothetical protein [Conexibacter stalactiti]
MSPTVDEIRRTAEARLRELEPVLAEAEQLRVLLAAIDAPSTTLPPRLSAVGSTRPADRRQRDGRAPQGANKQLILDIVARQPGVAAPEIAAATGLKRTVVASTISRLKRVGELEAHGRGVRLPRAAAAVA